MYFLFEQLSVAGWSDDFVNKNIQVEEKCRENFKSNKKMRREIWTLLWWLTSSEVSRSSPIF